MYVRYYLSGPLKNLGLVRIQLRDPAQHVVSSGGRTAARARIFANLIVVAVRLCATAKVSRGRLDLWRRYARPAVAPVHSTPL